MWGYEVLGVLGFWIWVVFLCHYFVFHHLLVNFSSIVSSCWCRLDAKKRKSWYLVLLTNFILLLSISLRSKYQFVTTLFIQVVIWYSFKEWSVTFLYYVFRSQCRFIMSQFSVLFYRVLVGLLVSNVNISDCFYFYVYVDLELYFFSPFFLCLGNLKCYL